MFSADIYLVKYTHDIFWIICICSFIKVGEVGNPSAFMTYLLEPENRFVPKHLGYKTSSNSVGLFTFGSFGQNARK